ncbi:MAG TPA: hypothetical protein VMX55_07070 [candidate division Zixibacteria bacterium]|nr:hypothetical protein [candidate division Zixibacteria bacterium]
MKKSTKIIILASIMTLFSTSFLFIQPAVAWVEQYGWESTNSGGMVSQIKIQAHAVYNDNDQGGVTAFGIWLNGKYDTGWCTKIVAYLYVSAEYDVQEINWRTREYRHYTYWDPAPSIFMSWGGEYSYNSGVPSEWTWSAGAEAYGMSLGASYKANPYSGYGTASSTSGDYRYLGWFKSEYDMFGGHEFSALLKLHVINDEAQDWANGIYYEYWPIERLTKIINIHVQIVFKFYYYFAGWWCSTTRTYVMGDGTPYTDLNYIPLVCGTVP